MNFLKKSSALFLAGAFLFASVGIINFRIAQWQVGKKMVELLASEEELMVLEFSPLEFDKLLFVEDDEFILHGNMYDVKEKWCDASGTVFLKCYHDKKEKTILSDIQKLSPASATSSETFFHVFPKPFYFSLTDFESPCSIHWFSNSGLKFSFAHFLIHCPSVVILLSTPPPRMIT